MTFSFSEDNFGISLDKYTPLYLSDFFIVTTLFIYTHHYQMGRKNKQLVQNFLLLALPPSDYTISAEKYLFPAIIQNNTGNLLCCYTDISKLCSLTGAEVVKQLVLRFCCPQYTCFRVLLWPTL